MREARLHGTAQAGVSARPSSRRAAPNAVTRYGSAELDDDEGGSLTGALTSFCAAAARCARRRAAARAALSFAVRRAAVARRSAAVGCVTVGATTVGATAWTAGGGGGAGRETGG